MSIILHFIIRAGLQVGIPVCDIDLTKDECRTLEQTAGEGSAPTYGSSTRNMRKAWKIYNGF